MIALAAAQALSVWIASVASGAQAIALAVAPAAAPAEDAPDARYGAPLALEDIELELQQLARENSSLVRLEELGTSRGGRAIPLLIVTRGETGPDADKPGLLVVGDRGGAPSEGSAEAALDFAWSVVRAVDPELARLPHQASLYVVPVLDPDARAGEETAGPSLERDFPCGWQATPEGPQASLVPLSRPESLALARFLAEHANLALVVAGLPEAAVESEDGALPLADRDACRALLQRLALPAGTSGGTSGGASWGFPTRPAATLLDYACFAQGTFALGWPSSTAAGESGFGARVRERSATLAALARELPRLELTLAEPAAASTGICCVDVRVANVGGLPTESALSALGRADRGVVLAVSGARVMASALRDAEGAFRLPAQAGASEGSVRLGRLEPGGERWVRLVLEAASGAEITVEVRAACAAGAAQTLRLP